MAALETTGWVVEALDARLAEARVAIVLGRRRLAQRELEHVERERIRRTAGGPAPTTDPVSVDAVPGMRGPSLLVEYLELDGVLQELLGSVGRPPGDALLGLAAALLSLGSQALIGSVLPVPDEAARSLMVRLHNGLRTGSAPAVVLAEARQSLADAEPWIRVAADAFLCLGAG